VGGCGCRPRHAGARVGIAHCSSPDVADLIQRERGAGDAVVAEACPQYFVLREDEALEHGALRKFTPPVRARDDGDEAAMWSRLRDGALAYVASDHAPSTMEQKCSVDLWGAPFGLPGLDTTMALLLDAVADGRLTLADLVRVYSTAPARRYGLRGKGALAVGADGDVCLVDLSRTRTLRGEEMRSKAGWTPYEGRTVRGDVVGTWLRGRRVAQDGDVHGPPQGRFQAGPGGRR
jgi:dihydroorotase-like cyclic amidohydrolase